MMDKQTKYSQQMEMDNFHELMYHEGEDEQEYHRSMGKYETSG